MALKLPDLGLASFESDEWRFGAVCVVVIGVAVVPSYLIYRNARERNQQNYQIALRQAETKLEQARQRSASRAKSDASASPTTVH